MLTPAAIDAVPMVNGLVIAVVKPTPEAIKTNEIAVKRDVNGDGVTDIRDVVRAKKATAGAEVLSDSQLMAAGVAEGGSITVTEVAALRDVFMK